MLAGLGGEVQRTMSIVMALLAPAWIGCASRQAPASFVKHYVELHRSRDIDGLLALHANDAEFMIPGQETIRGMEALRDLLEWDAVLETELTMAGISADGDTIFIDSLVERNKWFQAIGLPEVRYRSGTRIVLRGGRIVGTYPAPFDDDTQQRLRDRFEALVQWLREYRRDALEQLLPGGKFRYNAASARRWLEVLAEWNKSQRLEIRHGFTVDDAAMSREPG